MKIPSKVVYPLNDGQINKLKEIMSHSDKPRVRQRAHAILLSSKSFTLNEIANIWEVNRDTVSNWLNRWEQFGLSGLDDQPRSGNPGILTPLEKQLVIKLCQETPRSVSQIRASLLDQTGKRASKSTIKRLLKAAQLTWKRVRKSMKEKRDEEEFRAAPVEIKELIKPHNHGEIELWFFDESGLDQQPSVPYAWQPVGSTLEIPSQRSTRLNVLAFLTPDNQLESYGFEGTVNTDVVIAGFDQFAQLKTSKPRYVIIDNASIHTSTEFILNLDQWEKKGLVIRSLPTYCSELNRIEILWRFIKYSWLPFSAYLSFNNLVLAVENILKHMGSQFYLHFAS